MALSSTSHTITYTGNGSTTTAYTIPFAFADSTHVKAAVSSDGVEEAVDLASGEYTVTALSDMSGGTLTTSEAVTDPATITIYRDTPQTQPTTFQLAGPFPSTSAERGLDRLGMQIQELSARVDDIVELTVPEGEFSGACVVRVASNGNATGYTPASGTATARATALRAALADATSGTAIKVGGVSFNVGSTPLSDSLAGGVSNVVLELSPATVLNYSDTDTANADWSLFPGIQRHVRNFGAVPDDSTAGAANIAAFNIARATGKDQGGGIPNTDGSPITECEIDFGQGTYYFDDSIRIGGNQRIKRLRAQFNANFAPSAGKTWGTFPHTDIDTTDNEFTLATHGLAQGQRIRLSSSGTLFTATTSIVGSTTNTSTAVTFSTVGINKPVPVGAAVSGTGISGGTTVSAKSASGITLSAAATATGTVTLTFTWTVTSSTDLYAYVVDKDTFKVGMCPELSVYGVCDLTAAGSGTYTLTTMEQFGLIVDKPNNNPNSSNTTHNLILGDVSLAAHNTGNENFSGACLRAAQLSDFGNFACNFRERGVYIGNETSGVHKGQFWLNAQASDGSYGMTRGTPALHVDNGAGISFDYVSITGVQPSALTVDGDGDICSSALFSGSNFIHVRHLVTEDCTSGLKIKDSLMCNVRLNASGRGISGSYAAIIRGDASDNSISPFQSYQMTTHVNDVPNGVSIAGVIAGFVRKSYSQKGYFGSIESLAAIDAITLNVTTVNATGNISTSAGQIYTAAMQLYDGTARGQLAYSGGNTYLDYSGTLTGRAGYAGSTVWTISSAGLITTTGGLTMTACNLATDTTTGMKVGTATTQKLGFWNATPVVQPTAVADASGGVTVDTEGRAAINALLSRMRTLGLIAT